ncbi:MAG: hypothetical protein IJ122_06325 [Methanobrevibacter sp.]|nr:hypothetical protein [Methanobrevibacter sp.]
MNKQFYIYKITNLITGDFYVGKRLISSWNNYYGSGVDIKKAIKKYGKENFHREILKYVEGFDNAAETEKKFIMQLNPQYNRMKSYDEERIQHSPKTKLQWSKTRTGRQAWNKGKTLSKEHKKHLSESHKGNFGEKNGFYGKHHTKESIEKANRSREIARNKKTNEELRQISIKRSEALKKVWKIRKEKQNGKNSNNK